MASTKVLLPVGGMDPLAEPLLSEVAEILYCFDESERPALTPMRSLFGTPVSPERKAELAARQHARIAELLPEIDGIYLLGVNGPVAMTEEMMEAAPSLKVIGGPGSGTDFVDADAATRRGIAVVNAAGAAYMPVAEHVLGMMLSLTKRIAELDRRIHSDGGWPRTPAGGIAGVNDVLDGKTIGIVGLGFVGREVARKCRLGFNMRVLAFDPFVDPTAVRAQGVTLVTDLHDLLPECDFVSLNLPLNPSTRHLIGATELSLMKPSSYLVNTSRGDTVDQSALVAALRDATIAGAGLDVFHVEPMAEDDPLCGLENVILTPHIAGVVHNLPELVTRGTFTEMARVLSGKRPWHPVNPELLYTGSARWLRSAPF